MARKNINFYLIKVTRITGWLLFPLMILYILTGFSLCGEFGFERVVSPQVALAVHQIFEWPLIVAFLVHSSVTFYFAFRRWGWIKKRTGS